MPERHSLHLLERQPDGRVGVLELGNFHLAGPRLHLPHSFDFEANSIRHTRHASQLLLTFQPLQELRRRPVRGINRQRQAPIGLRSG